MGRANWIETLFRAIDAKDADGFAEFLAPDVQFRFGNGPAADGWEAARHAVASFFSSIAALRHDVQEVLEAGDTVVLRGEVTYWRKDGSQLTVPFANIFKMAAGRIREYL